MGWFEWLNPAWTAAEIAFHPTELNVGEDTALAYHEGYEKGQHDPYHDTSHHSADHGHGHDSGSGQADGSQ